MLRSLAITGLAMLLVVQSDLCRAQWVKVSDTSIGTVNALVASGGILIAGTPSGFFTSADSGSSWIASDSGLMPQSYFRYVTSIAEDDSTLYAGVILAGVYESTDYGKQWTEISTGLTYRYVWGLCASGNLLFAGTAGDGVFRSTDRGASWDSVNTGLPTEGYAYPIVFLGTKTFVNDYGATYFSDDSGGTWSSGGPPDINAFLIVGSTLYAGCFGGIYKSSDTGTTWAQLLSFVTATDGFLSLANFDSVIFAGTKGGGVLVSSDSGMNWSSIGNSLPDTNIKSLAVDGGYLFAGAQNGIWRRPLSGIGSNVVEFTPASSSVLAAYPNPFSRSIIISFTSLNSGEADVSIVNLLGAPVARIFSGELAVGEHSFTWDASAAASGAYECIVRMNGQVMRVPVVVAR